MYKWKCPYCGGNMYSAYNFYTDKKVNCIGCGKEFSNKYYRKEDNYEYDKSKDIEGIGER